MKKFIIVLVLLCNLTTVNAVSSTPKYKIIANGNTKEDIDEMYDTKNDLITDYRSWVKGVKDTYQVLNDHKDVYNATLKDDVFIIVLGKGKGKSLEGDLKTNYCSSSKDIKKKSIIEEIFNS